MSDEQGMTDDISQLHTLHIIAAEIRKYSGGTAHIAVEVQAKQIGSDKGLRAFCPDIDEFMNRLGRMLCCDEYRWRQIENLLNQQGIVSVAGSDAELAFTGEELKELGLEEADVRRAA
jgi:hypothetical protein